MPIYDHQCQKCEYIWEDLFSSYKSPVPEECPKCKIKGKIKRIMSIPAVGVVEVNAQDRPRAFKEAQQKFRKEMQKNENERANVIGEERYHQIKSTEAKINESH